MDAAVAQLLAGGVILYPTETFYALGASIAHEAALQRMVGFKRREAHKPFPLIAADAAQARSLWSGPVPAIAEALMRQFWPGPLTLVLPAREGLSATVRSELGVGVRVSPHPMARELARRAGPITATSANLSGQDERTAVSAFDSGFLAGLDAIVDGGETPGGLPSTVLAFVKGVPTILRQGALAREVLTPWLGAP